MLQLLPIAEGDSNSDERERDEDRPEIDGESAAGTRPTDLVESPVATNIAIVDVPAGDREASQAVADTTARAPECGASGARNF
jgi:hypothetical protein